jgi:serine/threonine protein kinase
MFSKKERKPPHLYIADFGLVNKIGGTPVYLSPENLEKTVVEKTDVYGLGMTLLYSVCHYSLMSILLFYPIDNNEYLKSARNYISSVWFENIKTYFTD